MSERYSLDAAMRRVRKPMDQIKEVMRYSDVTSVSISKWRKKDADGKYVDRFHTTIFSDLDEGEENIYEEE